MVSQLARRFQIDVSTTGLAGTWLPFRGVQDWAPKENPTIQSTLDFDSGGFDTGEKTVTTWSLVAKIRHILNTGTPDPGQELARVAGQYQFLDASRLYVRYYDRFAGVEAWQGRAIMDWTPSKTGAADVEEVTVTFRGDGILAAIANPVTIANTPVISSVVSTPAIQVAGGLIRIVGAYFTGTVPTTGVKINGIPATSWDVVSDSLIEAILATALLAPATTLGATAGTGGTFAAATYFWVVTAVNAVGESIASNEVSAAVGANGTQIINWGVVAGATGYKVYRGTVAGGENALITTIGSGATVTYTDTGTAGSVASPTSKAGVVVTNAVGASLPAPYVRG